MGKSLHSFKINKVDLVVSDIEQSIIFYTKTLGFHLIDSSEGEADLGTEDGSCLVHLLENKQAVRPGRNVTGLYHFAILVPERKHLAAFLKHILETNYPLVGASDHLFSEAIYLQDPDDIGIEIYVDRPKEEWRYRDGQIQAATLPLDTNSLMQAYTEDWISFPNGTVIGHLHFHVSTIEKAREFYVGKFGLDPMIEMGDQVLFVSGEGYHHHIGLNIWNGQHAKVPTQPVLGMNRAHVEASKADRPFLLANGLNESDHTIIDPFGIEYIISFR